MWMLNDCKWQSQIFKDTINALKKKCQEESKNIDMLQDYIKFNTLLDEHRGQSLIDCDKELHKILEQL